MLLIARPRNVTAAYRQLFEGDIGVYGIAVLGFFSGGISVIQVPRYGIAVCGSPTVCGFSSF